MDDLITLNKKIINNEININQLYENIIDQIKNDELNIFAHTRIDKALFELQTTDFSNKPFKGIPILIKNLGQELKGELNTSSSLLLKDYVSCHTDNIVKRLQDLGFIIIGQTNTPEFGFKNTTTSKMYQTTLNALSKKHHAGGSSGGAAAAVSAGIVPIALASDGGGSIRIPASYHGLIGLKPSRGRIITGPVSHRGWQGASIHFPITKTIDDTILMLDLLSDYIKESPYSIPKESTTFSEQVSSLKNKKLKIAYSITSPVNTKVTKEAVNAVLDIKEKLEKLGHTLVEANPKYDGIKLIESYYLMNAAEANTLISDLTNQPSLDNLEPLSYVLYHLGSNVNARNYIKAINYWDEVSLIMDNFLNDYDLFLTPATNGSAPLLNSDSSEIDNLSLIKNVSNLGFNEQFDLLKNLFQKSLAKTPFSQIANLTGHPAISLPTYLDKTNNLPIGIQLISQREREDLLLYLGKELELNNYFITKREVK